MDTLCDSGTPVPWLTHPVIDVVVAEVEIMTTRCLSHCSPACMQRAGVPKAIEQDVDQSLGIARSLHAATRIAAIHSLSQQLNKASGIRCLMVAA